MADEKWCDIPNYALYQASTEGRIRNRLTGRILPGTRTKKGYCQVNVRNGRRRQCAYAHRLVAMAFIGVPPPGFVVNHLNTNKLDNRPLNLEWTTPAGNSRHAAAHGLIRTSPLYGEKNPNAKLTADEVRQMRTFRQQGMSLAELSRRFRVSVRCAHYVVTRKNWKHVS